MAPFTVVAATLGYDTVIKVVATGQGGGRFEEGRHI